MAFSGRSWKLMLPEMSECPASPGRLSCWHLSVLTHCAIARLRVVLFGAARFGEPLLPPFGLFAEPAQTGREFCAEEEDE